jgi:hypothetical protein
MGSPAEIRQTLAHPHESGKESSPGPIVFKKLGQEFS